MRDGFGEEIFHLEVALRADYAEDAETTKSVRRLV